MSQTINLVCRAFPDLLSICSKARGGNSNTGSVIWSDLKEFTELIKLASPLFIAIGADSKWSWLEEPSREKVFGLIKNIESLGIKYYLKDNISRILNSKIK